MQSSRAVSGRLQQRFASRQSNQRGPANPPAWFLDLIDKVEDELNAGEEPQITGSELQACVRLIGDCERTRAAAEDVTKSVWHLSATQTRKVLTLFALALRRCASGTLHSLGGSASLPPLRFALGGCLGLFSEDADLAPHLALACLRGDALLVYNTLLAKHAVYLKAHALPPTGPSEGDTRAPQQQQQDADEKLPSLAFVSKSATDLLHESQALVSSIRGVLERTAATEPRSPDPLTMHLHSSSGSDSSRGGPADALLARQCLQQGLLDSCCRVTLQLLHLTYTSGASAARLIETSLLQRQLAMSLSRLFGSPASRGMWLGSVAGRAPPPPASCPPPCAGAEGSSGKQPTDSRDVSSSSSSSTLPATATGSCGTANASAKSSSIGSYQLPAPAVGRLLPSAMQCLLAVHVVSLCALLDGGPTYGLREVTPGGPQSLGMPSSVPLLSWACDVSRTLRPVRPVTMRLALVAVGVWAHARGLWDGSEVRDVWWLPARGAAGCSAEGAGQAGSGAGGSSAQSGGGMGRGRNGRSAAAAAAVLRRQLAEAEAAVQAAEARAAGPSSSAWAAAEGAAAAVAAAAGRLAELRRTLAALEVEAAAEQLPPLNRIATVELCRRLVAACKPHLSGSSAAERHEVCDQEGTVRLAGAALRCWRLALAPERRCRRRPTPPAAVRRLEAWWQAVVEVMEAVQQQEGLETHTVGSTLLFEVNAEGVEEPQWAYIGRRCKAPLPDALPTCPQPEVAAALKAGFMDTLATCYAEDSGAPGPALLLCDMQLQQGAWTEAAMFGSLEQLVSLLIVVGDRVLGAACDKFACAEPGPQRELLPPSIALCVAFVSPMLDAHVVSCLVHLAQLCANTQPPPASDSPSSTSSQVPSSPSSPASSSSTVKTGGAAFAGAEAAPSASGPGTTLPPLPQLGLVASCTAVQLLRPICRRLLQFPCDRASRLALAQEADAWLHVVQVTAGWVVQWLLLLLQVAIVDTGCREGETVGQGMGGRQEQLGAECGDGAGGGAVPVAAADDCGQEHAGQQPGRRGVGVAEAWRRDLQEEFDVVGTLLGVVRLLATYPRVCRGARPGVEQLRDMVDPGPIAACLDAVAAAFPDQVHAAVCGQEGQGQGSGSSSSSSSRSGAGRGGGGGGRAALLSVRVLLGKGGPLEVDGGSWVGSGASCFWAVVERGPGGLGEEVGQVVREAGERVGSLVGLVVPSEEMLAKFKALELPFVTDSDDEGSD